MKKFLLTVSLILFSVLLAVSAWKIFDTVRDYKAGQDTYTAMEQYVSPAPQAKPEPSAPTVQQEANLPEAVVEENPIDWPTVDFEALTALNPDVVGWLCFPGTNINYPVVQADDNSYYLNRMVDGTYNPSGSIFLDAAASPDLSDRHTIIYGHHMKDQTMFSALMDYKEQTFYDGHTEALLLTPDQNYQILLFAGYVTDTSVNAWEQDFDNTDFGHWISDQIQRSAFIPAVTPEEDARIITFSTCTYEYEQAKFVLHGYIAKTAIPGENSGNAN